MYNYNYGYDLGTYAERRAKLEKYGFKQEPIYNNITARWIEDLYLEMGAFAMVKDYA